MVAGLGSSVTLYSRTQQNTQHSTKHSAKLEGRPLEARLVALRGLVQRDTRPRRLVRHAILLRLHRLGGDRGFWRADGCLRRGCMLAVAVFAAGGAPDTINLALKTIF